MTIEFTKIEEYLKSLGKNYSVVFTFKKNPLHQIKIHYAPHSSEFYYSFRNREKVDISTVQSVDLSDVRDISFYSGLLISSFGSESFSDLLMTISSMEHFPIQKPEVLTKSTQREN